MHLYSFRPHRYNRHRSPPSMKLIRRYVKDGSVILTFNDGRFSLALMHKPKYRCGLHLELVLQGLPDERKRDEEKGSIYIIQLTKPWMNPDRWRELHKLLEEMNHD